MPQENENEIPSTPHFNHKEKPIVLELTNIEFGQLLMCVNICYKMGAPIEEAFMKKINQVIYETLRST